MSDVLFWRQRVKSDDPFLEPNLPAAFYHPSLPKSLTKEESQIKLGPEKLHHEEDKENIKKEELTPEGKAFIQRTNTLLAKELPTRDTPSPRDTSSKFEESWPTSERPSTIESPPEPRSLKDEENEGNISRTSSTNARSKTSSKMETQEFNLSTLLNLDKNDYPSDPGVKIQSSQASSHHGSSLKKSSSSPQHDSVLARYIHRFRHGEPQSREERSAKGQSSGAKELWWLSPPTRDTSVTSSSGTHSYTCSRDVTKHCKVPPRNRGLSSSSVSSSSFYPQNKRISTMTQRESKLSTRGQRQDTIPTIGMAKGRYASPSRCDDIPSSSTPVMDAETLLLQEKAQHLLEISESSLSSDPIVSSDGIGSSPSLPSREEMGYIPPDDISPIREKEPVDRSVRNLIQSHSRPQKYLKPEDDILYQWRLRRKMELAKQGGNLKTGPDNPLVGRERIRLEHRGPPTLQEQDLTLEAFRARLHQDRLSNHMSELPLHKDRQLSSVGLGTSRTATIPQTISTQAGAGEERLELGMPHSFMDSSSQKRNVQHGRHHTKISPQDEHHGPPLPSNRVEQQPSVTSGSPPTFTVEQRPIASPNKESASQHKYNVLPHWHMSCDIIPCHQGNVPHIHAEDELIKCDSKWTRIDSGDRAKGSHSSKEWHRENEDESGNRNKMKTEEDDDRSERQHPGEMQGNEKMQLQAENKRKSEEKNEQGYRQTKVQGQKDLEFSKRSGIPRLKQRIGGLGKDAEPVNKERQGVHPVYQPDRKHKRTGRDGRMVRTNERIEKTSPRSSDTEPFTDMSAEEDRGMDETEGNKQESTTEVQSTIGQVITQRLFDPDSPKLSKTSSYTLSKSTTQVPCPGGVSKQEESTSDSDEFSDDSLLQMLRQKRALYEKQLQQIDDAIASKAQIR